MRSSTTNKATLEIATLLEGWLDGIQYAHELPHLPPDVAYLMAKEAFKVLEILAVGEKALTDDGILGGGDE